MRRFIVALVSVSLAGLAGLLTATDTAGALDGCSHYNEHLRNGFTVATGQECVLSNTIVDGGMGVSPNGSLHIVNGSNIRGAVNDYQGYVEISNSTVAGGVTLEQPRPFAQGGGSQPSDNFAAEICRSRVGGVTVHATPAGNDGVIIGASFYEVHGGGCFVSEGVSNSSAAGNILGGGLSITYNNAPVIVSNNVINGGVTCWYNNPPPSYNPSTNRASGARSGQCA